ncbi:hypothetical protein [Hymenobacter lucidus]|uniref:Four helix bundle protein n=1 Tax=Hymenobacter lucidus TaxID=2880930 RepID=A0ABS8AW34_9BACT|nr:hypothetical protein [Hymenobacter lucidus]MCB2409386.1 hypothetical protein [Hymenobacter lucidus]
MPSAAYSHSYQLLLRKAGDLYEALLALYKPDIQTEHDFAARTVLATEAQRTGVAWHLARTNELSPASTALLIQSMGRYLDSHWDDYREIPTADPEKFVRREHLHAALEGVISKISELQNKPES